MKTGDYIVFADFLISANRLSFFFGVQLVEINCLQHGRKKVFIDLPP